MSARKGGVGPGAPSPVESEKVQYVELAELFIRIVRDYREREEAKLREGAA